METRRIRDAEEAKMKGETVRKIREAITPRVTIESAHDVPDGIVFELRQEYDLGKTPPSLPRKMAKTINIKADKNGNILSCEGLV